MVLGGRDLPSARGGLPRCPGSALRPYTGAGGYRSAGAGRGPSPVALHCGSVRGEGCRRPGSFKGNDGGDKWRSAGFNCVRVPAHTLGPRPTPA